MCYNIKEYRIQNTVYIYVCIDETKKQKNVQKS